MNGTRSNGSASAPSAGLIVPGFARALVWTAFALAVLLLFMVRLHVGSSPKGAQSPSQWSNSHPESAFLMGPVGGVHVLYRPFKNAVLEA